MTQRTGSMEELIAVTCAAVELFDRQMRRTGRTEEMLARVEPGDQVVVPTREVADYVRSRLRDIGKDGIVVTAVEPNDRAFRHIQPSTDGRTFFDHTWSLAFYLVQVKELGQSFHAWDDHLNPPEQGVDSPPISRSPDRGYRVPNEFAQLVDRGLTMADRIRQAESQAREAARQRDEAVMARQQEEEVRLLQEEERRARRTARERQELQDQLEEAQRVRTEERHRQTAEASRRRRRARAVPEGQTFSDDSDLE